MQRRPGAARCTDAPHCSGPLPPTSPGGGAAEAVLRGFCPPVRSECGEARHPGPAVPGRGQRKKSSRPRKSPGVPEAPVEASGVQKKKKKQAVEGAEEEVEERPETFGGRRKKGEPRVRDVKRGAAAWENARRAGRVFALESERLLIHSVADSTALNNYIPALKKLVAWGTERAPSCRSWDELDRAVVVYLTGLCYFQDKHPH